MKRRFLHVITAVTLTLFSGTITAQAPPLGTAKDFVLFTSVGAMQNVGTYQYLTLITGNVGTNSGSNTNFGNVNGVMHAGDGASIQCAADVLAAYNFLADAIPEITIGNPVLGSGATYNAGTYFLPGTTSLDGSIILDGQGNANAVFIFKMPAGPPNYALSTSVNAQVELINGAQASNVFWFVTGAVSMGAETSMKGTIIAGGAITMSAGSTLEGRALTINGSVTVDNGAIGLSAYLPVDIAASLPTGPAAPVFVESKPYAVFSTIGDVSDDGTSHVAGSVGSNTALPTGFNPLFVSGNIEGMNPATAGAAADLLLVYNSLSTLTADIELLAPAQFGHNLVLTPHCYVMNSAVTFTDTIFLDATGNEDAVFIIKTYGAFESGVKSRVILKNGTQAKNIFWMVNGAVSIGDSSLFKGTIIANNGAIDLLKGASIDGRALTTNGSVSTTGMTTVLPIPMVSINHENLYVCDGDSAGFVVTAIGKGSYTYQWRKGTENLSNGGSISGVTNDTLVIDPVSDSDLASDYNVLVFDALEPSDTTANAALSFHPVPTITKDPASQAVCIVGNSASFSVTAEGAYLTYQWRIGTENLTNTGNISGATSQTLTVNPVAIADVATDYNVVVSDVCGRDVTSADASLSINDLPTAPTASVTLQPTCDEPTGTITVSSAITGHTFSIDGSDYSNTTGTFTSVDAGVYQVTARTTNGCTSARTSVELIACTTSIGSIDAGKDKAVIIFPNPFKNSINIIINDASQINNCTLKIYNVIGTEVLNKNITKHSTTFETSNLHSGVYLYKVINNGQTIQYGKLISK